MLYKVTINKETNLIDRAKLKFIVKYAEKNNLEIEVRRLDNTLVNLDKYTIKEKQKRLQI